MDRYGRTVPDLISHGAKEGYWKTRVPCQNAWCRKGERPGAHLASLTGILQADAYAGFERSYGERIQEASCWAHCPESVFIRRAYRFIMTVRCIRRECADRLYPVFGCRSTVFIVFAGDFGDGYEAPHATFLDERADLIC